VEFSWRNFDHSSFWQSIPLWKDVSREEFADHKWQDRNAIVSFKKFIAVASDLASPSFVEDAKKGFEMSPMAVRISPYLFSLIDWNNPVEDPIRTQFLPLASQLQSDHPMLTFDSLHEQEDAPVKGLTHRYEDKVLFLALDICPVYCRFCTRSYAVGSATPQAEKVSLKASKNRWQDMFNYLRENPQVEDVVISGGDSYRLKASQITEIGEELLKIDHIRRFRFATKGPAIMPMKITSDLDWTNAIAIISDKARKQRKEVCIHTHFNHPRELTGFTEEAMGILFERGIKVRNQAVFQRGVNDDAETMIELTKKMSYVNVQPYYVYIHDLVKGTEDLRTSVQTGLDVEKRLRGVTAGFNTPMFVVDAPEGGGKRDAHSFEHYDRETGISVYTAPSVKEGRYFLYYDPLHSLSKSIQRLWSNPRAANQMIKDVLFTTKRSI
jgi:lysine 2,3-aminomutase